MRMMIKMFSAQQKSKEKSAVELIFHFNHIQPRYRKIRNFSIVWCFKNTQIILSVHPNGRLSMFFHNINLKCLKWTHWNLKDFWRSTQSLIILPFVLPLIWRTWTSGLTPYSWKLITTLKWMECWVDFLNFSLSGIKCFYVYITKKFESDFYVLEFQNFLCILHPETWHSLVFSVSKTYIKWNLDRNRQVMWLLILQIPTSNFNIEREL